jgi:hypothetical protein
VTPVPSLLKQLPYVWFQRKLAKNGKRVVGLKALANKLSKACFFMMRDDTSFDVKRLVGA